MSSSSSPATLKGIEMGKRLYKDFDDTCRDPCTITKCAAYADVFDDSDDVPTGWRRRGTIVRFVSRVTRKNNQPRMMVMPTSEIHVSVRATVVFALLVKILPKPARWVWLADSTANT